jgi:rhodanese-related sulfurtransferase
MKLFYGTLALSLIGGIILASGCNAPVGPTPTPTPEPKSQFETVREALDAYFSSDPPGTIGADVVFDQLNDGDDSTNPYVLSVRSAEHYALGHVPGAANVPWQQVANVGALDDLPTDRQVVVYCYTGHTGAVATCFLNALGYDAVNMRHGIGAWTPDATVRAVPPFSQETDGNDFPTETTDNPATQTYDPPALDVTDSTDPAEIIRAAGEAYLTAGKAPTISAATVFDLINDGDDSTNPFIISVRSPEDYAKGHIPGAINIPWKTIAKPENLAKIPTDRQIIVYCYTGHTAGLATMALDMLGYDAVNMKFGICAWTSDPDIRASTPFNQATDGYDYPVEP